MKTKREQRGLGDDLRSQEVTLQVPSALAGLTAGFEKGPGVPPPLQTPRNRLCCNHKLEKAETLQENDTRATTLQHTNTMIHKDRSGDKAEIAVAHDRANNQTKAATRCARAEEDKRTNSPQEEMEEKPSTISTG